MQTVKDFDVKNKRILVRVDLNLPLSEKGEVLDDLRIKAILPTINYLLEQDAKIILMSHLGRPGGKVVKSLRMESVRNKLAEYVSVPVIGAQDCVGEEIEKQIQAMLPREIILLENLRFHPEEESNDPQFSQDLAKLGDIYINEAFSNSHREHASMVGVPQYLPHGIGLYFEKEIGYLSKITRNPQRPLVGIIGGAKVETKIKLLTELIKSADYILVGGVVANTILQARGLSVGQSKVGEGSATHAELWASDKLVLPVDVVVAEDKNGGTGEIKNIKSIKAGESIFDIGPETRELFKGYIQKAGTIFWNGPLGLAENKEFAGGSAAIAQAIAGSDVLSIAGGGETVDMINDLGLEEKFGHISTGGGAMLDFLSDQQLPALEALERDGVRGGI